jgi:hypothetical protein
MRCCNRPANSFIPAEPCSQSVFFAILSFPIVGFFAVDGVTKALK